MQARAPASAPTAAQSAGGDGGANYLRKNAWFAYTTCGGAGGGAGASGESAYGIGSGGDGGAGGAGGGGGGHYRDGVGGSSYIGYFYCGGEGGKGATAADDGANGKDGAATQDITEDKLGTKYTSKSGIAGISAAGSVKSPYITYRSLLADAHCNFKMDQKDLAIPTPTVYTLASEFADEGGYTTTLTFDANNGTYTGDAKQYKITIVPGADPISVLYKVMTSSDNAKSPLRTGYALHGYSISDQSSDEFFEREENDATVSGSWKNDGTDNLLVEKGYVVGELGTDESSLKGAVLTNFESATLYAVWQANDYSVTYNRNETLLNTLGVKTMPKWVKVSDTAKSQDTTESTDVGFAYDTATKLAISSSMHSGTAEVEFPSNQKYYLENANSGQYVLKGWTKSIDAAGNAMDTVYKCGEEVTRLTDGHAVTLYAVWGAPEDIYAPTFIPDADLTLPFEYSADASKLNVRAVPYWSTDSKGDYGSYFVAAIYGESPTRTLSTEWQMYDESDGSWKKITTNDAYGGYKSALDDSAFTDDFTFNGSEYKAGKYQDRSLKATLSIPQGATVGTNNKYRCVFKLSAASGSASADELVMYSPAITFKVIKADYDTSKIVIKKSDGFNITTNTWKTSYTGEEMSLSVSGLPEKLSASVHYFDSNGARLDTAPVDPGAYFAHIVYTTGDAGYNTPEEKVIKIVIEKQEVRNPEPKRLTYKISDYTTGEAAVQCAFEENELYTASNATASEAGDYLATFTLKDTSRYQWLVNPKATKQVYYRISPLKVTLDSDEITVDGKSYSVTWKNTTYNYDGEVHSASLTSSLFGDGSSEGVFPDWVTGWKDGKPSSKSAAYFVYYVDNGDGTFTNVVGYDVNGNVITKEQIEAWKSGSTSSVDAKSFSDVAEFGVKSPNVKQVSVAFDTNDSNIKISGESYAPFTIAPAGATPVLLSSKATEADGKTKYVPAPSYVNASGEIVNGLPAGVKSITFYEWDTSAGAWKTDAWGKYNYDGTTSGGISVPASEDVKLKAVFEMTDTSYAQLDYQILSFNVELEGGIVAVPTAANNLIYNGNEQCGIEANEAYTLSGDKSGVNAGTYSTLVTLAAGYVWADGTSAPVTVTWSIAKKPVVAPAAATGLVYNGEAQDGVSSGEGYTVQGGTQVNAGDYSATVTLSSDNYRWINSDKEDTFNLEWSIAKMEIDVPQATTGLVYNGQEQQGVPNGIGYYLQGASATDAGGYVAIATLDGNHVWPEGDSSKRYVSWSIGAKKISVPTAAKGLVYNGEEQTGVAAGEGYTLSGDVSATNAGDYEVVASLFENGNYVWADSSTGDKTVKWSIAAKAVEAPVAAQGLVCNGEEQTGVAAGEGYTLSGTVSAKDAGEYEAVATLKDSYVWSDGDTAAKHIKWLIAAKAVEAPTAAEGLVYNGEEQTGVAAGEGYTLSGVASATAAGEYEAVAKLDANCAWTDGTTADKSIKWRIAAKAVEAPVAAQGLVYNGEEQTGVAAGEGYTLSGTVSAKDAGEYEAVAKLDANCAWTDGTTADKSIKWRIAAKAVEAPAAAEGLVYNGEEQTGVAAGEGYTLSGTVSAKDAGEYEAVATLEDSYVWSDGTAADKRIKWSIAEKPANISVDVPSGWWLTYNGREQSGVAENNAYRIHGTWKATDAGTYTATLVLNDGYVWSDGSTDKVKDVKWTISKAKSSVKITNKTKKAKRSKAAKKAVELKPITVKGLPGGATLSFAKQKSGSSKKAYKALKVNANTGKITVKKGTKKGTYKMKVKITVSAANYETHTETITVKIKVK